MKPHLPVSMLSMLAVASASVMFVPVSEAATYVAQGVSVNDVDKSTRFYDSGKGYYWTNSSHKLLPAATSLYKQTGSFAFLGSLSSRIVNPSSSISANSFSRLTGDSDTCWYQASSNLIQYWLDTYSFYYQGGSTLPMGYTYDKKYVKELGGTQSLKVGMFMYDSFVDDAGNLDTAVSWFMSGLGVGTSLKSTHPQGGFFQKYFGYSYPISYSSYESLSGKSLKTFASDLLKGLGRNATTGAVEQQGQIVYLGLSALNVANKGHALTCYGLGTDSTGAVKTLYVCNSDDSAYKIFRLYPKISGGRIVLYSDAACTKLWSYSSKNWYVDGVSYISTPKSLLDIDAKYHDETMPISWNGKVSGKKWDMSAPISASRLPKDSDGWVVSIKPSGSVDTFAFPTFYDPKRAVSFDKNGVDSSGNATVNVVGTVSAPEIYFTGYDVNYTFAGASSAISTNTLHLGGDGCFNINVGKFTTKAIEFAFHYKPLELNLSKNTKFTCSSDVTCNNLTFTSNNATLGIPNLTMDFRSDLVMKNGCTFNGNLTMLKDSALTFHSVNSTNPALRVSGRVEVKGSMAVNINGSYTRNQVYPLMSFDSMSTTFRYMQVAGISGEYELFYAGSSLCLYVGDSPLSLSEAAWKSGTEGFVNNTGTSVRFTADSTEVDRDVYLTGNLYPAIVFTNGDGDVVFRQKKSEGGGCLAGDSRVVKLGQGGLHILVANTYTGGTLIGNGYAMAYYDTSFGTGKITMLGGSLYMRDLALPNTVEVNTMWTAKIKGGSKFAGNLLLTCGTADGDAINLSSGKKATLRSGSLMNQLTGAGRVVKDTAGTVYVYGSNTYTGGTTIEGGTLSAKNVKALGSGKVALSGGTLHMNSLALANTIEAAGANSIKGGSKYKGNLTLTKGTLSGDKINLASGKSATLKSGSLKNVLAGAGKVVKHTTATSYLFGSNTYTGGTTVKAGTLSAKNVKGLGTGAVTMNAGTLHLNSLAVTNSITVDATSANIKGGAKYKGKLTLTKGTLAGDKINIVSGKNAYLKTGTVKNALGGSGAVYKQGAGTVTLSGTNNWTGNTYVQGGTLVITGATTLRSTTRTSAGSKLDVRRAVTLGNLYLGGGTLAVKPGNMLTVTGTLTLANATKLALSGLTASNSILIKYGKLSNTSKKSLAQFFGLSSAYTVTNKSGKLTIAKAGSKKGASETFDVSPSALGQSTWGTARAARLFDHTVRDHARAQSVALDKNRSVWFAGMSGFSHVDDAADTNIYGGAVGMQFNGSMGGNVGLAIGQTFGHISPAGATSVKQQTQHAAIYGAKMLYISASDSVSLTGTASYGTTDADHEGYDWTQHSAVLGVRGTWEHKLDRATAVYGFAGLEYLATDAECGSGSIQALQGSIGAGISHTEGRLTLHADASFTPDVVRNAPSATVGTGRLGFELGAGATYRLSDQWSLNAGYTYHNEKRADSHEAYIGASCTF